MISSTKERKLRGCIMPTCSGERFDLVHKFPMENFRVEHWLQALDNPDLYDVPLNKLRSSYFICSRHFRKEDYKNALSRHLNKTAVPCLNLKSLDQIDQVLDRSFPRPDNLPNSVVVTIPAEQTVESSVATIAVDQGNDCISDDDQPATKTRRLNLNDQDVLGTMPKDGKISNLRNLLTRKNNSGYVIVKLMSQIDEPPEKTAYTVEELIGSNQIGRERSLSPEEYVKQEILDSVDDSVNEESEKEELLYEDVIEDVSEEMPLEAELDNEADTSYTMLNLDLPNNAGRLDLNNIWLRDHCRCSVCYNQETHQRRQNIISIPLEVKPLEATIDENRLLVKWNDGHESEYDLEFLCKSQLDTTKEPICKQVLWHRQNIERLDYSRVDFNNYLTDDDVAQAVMKSLIQFGFAFIEKVPANTNMTEAAIRRLFPVQKTFFGEMWTFSEEKDHSDTAYSKEFIGSHNDNTYFNDGAGLQVFHCLKHSGTGGETFLVDGFRVLADFMAKNPKGYSRLCSINVPAEYVEDGAHYTYTAPIIRLDPITKKPEQIRYNIYDRAVFNTIPQSEMYDFYCDFRSLAEEIERKTNQWHFKLSPGTVLIFDNWRILHGRESYAGKRQITGCYVSRSEFLNAARIMGLIS